MCLFYITSNSCSSTSFWLVQCKLTCSAPSEGWQKATDINPLYTGASVIDGKDMTKSHKINANHDSSARQATMHDANASLRIYVRGSGAIVIAHKLTLNTA